ncbi:MAG: T9SS type A sorting domain-containing protein [Bacteroidales bacterium]|nr:T9SS type A sorting domain-containing protein [Bacteroidales bacterium]
MRSGFLFSILTIIGLLFSQKLFAQSTSISVDTLTNLIDGISAPFNQIQPGDTIFFEPGRRDFILIRNFTGEAENPIIFMNKKGVVTISGNYSTGISIRTSRFIRLTGTGDEANFYGFKITGIPYGSGIGAGYLSSDFEIDHVSIENTKIAGIYAKTDPDCSFAPTRDNFTQFNTIIHDNYIANTGNEGMYIGSTKYFGQLITCDGKDTLLMPGLLKGVRIYNNIVKYAGWDGIQVSSASSDCQVYDNLVMYDSQAELSSQMSGIMLGGGSKCDCYNNYISSGKGCGIESHGLGGYRVFNNIIVDAGRSFKPLDTTQMKYGIYITDISVQTDSAFYVLHNDIINPKSDGIRFTSVLSKGSLIASNAIINPGNYDYYEHIQTSFTGEDSYIMLPNKASDVMITNNYFARNTDSTEFDGPGYYLKVGSVLIDNAFPDTKNIDFDANGKPRIFGSAPDIGAFEFNPAYVNIPVTAKSLVLESAVFPNPVKTMLTIHYNSESQLAVILNIYNLQGSRVIEKSQNPDKGKDHEIVVRVSNLPPGVYIYQLHSGKQFVSGKFIKAD